MTVGWRVFDRLRTDHPDPRSDKQLVLSADAGDGAACSDVIDVIDASTTAELPPGADPDRMESWDGVFAARLREQAGEGVAIAFAVSDETRLVTLFHAAATWLGIAACPLATVRLHLGSDDPALAAAFAREATRHREPQEMALPQVEWLAAEHQYDPIARAAWSYAAGAERPSTLSQRQLFAIRLYTSEFYLAFHRALRAGRGDDPVYRRMLPLVAYLDAALENLPAVLGITHRGERYDADSAASRRALEIGDPFEELSYVSSSRNQLHAAALRRGFLFNIQGCRGREISAFSEFPWEQEVLFGRGLVQRVLGKDCSERAIAEECDFETEEAGPGRFGGG